MFYKRNRKTLKKSRKSLKKSYKKSYKKARKNTRKSLKKLRGGNYNSEQKQQIHSKLSEFGFNNNEITDMLKRIDKSAQIFGTHVERALEQLDVIHRRHENNWEEQKEAIYEWINELENMSEDVLTDVEESQEF
jgi:hypothetical protein